MTKRGTRMTALTTMDRLPAAYHARSSSNHKLVEIWLQRQMETIKVRAYLPPLRRFLPRAGRCRRSRFYKPRTFVACQA